MRHAETFESLAVGETRTITFDFSSGLAAGESISAPSCSVALHSGVDATPSGLLAGSATASGAVVSQKVTSDTLGAIYNVTCTAPTSTSQTLIRSSVIAVVPARF